MSRGLRPRFRLWAKLALFGAAGVAATHSLHLVIGRDVATAAVVSAHDELGHAVARQVAHQAADAVLLDDRVALQDLVSGAVAGGRVSYCFIERNGTLLASSFADATPAALVGLRRGGARPASAPIVVRAGAQRYLDVAAPVLDGSAGWVRLGVDLRPLEETRYRLGSLLGLLSLCVIAGGVVAALLVGRRVARPVGELLSAADDFDPRRDVKPVTVRGDDEFAELAVRFNEMMARLRAAEEQHQATVRKSAASERLVALGALVAGVSHEVNNPLAGLKNCLGALRKGELPAARRTEYLGLMGESLDRIEHIVRRLLDFGRPRALALQEEAPERLLRTAVELVRPAAKERGVEVREVPSDDAGGARVRADRVQVGQAMLNLVLNALYVTPRGGEVRLKVRRRAGLCGLAVEDDGPGIPVELRERVLDPFVTTKPEGEGTGLGLTVTRTIVDAHGGELTFEFPGRGTVATVWLREVQAAA